MKKTYLYIALLMGASTLFSSCSDFLDREPITAPNNESFLSGESQVRGYINGLYTALPSLQKFGMGVRGEEKNSDNILSEIYDRRLNGEETVFSVIKLGKPVIRTCAMSIISFITIKTRESGNEEIKSLIGEAYFCSLLAFCATEKFGDIPVMDAFGMRTLLSPDCRFRKKDHNEVAKFILEDLDKAKGFCSTVANMQDCVFQRGGDACHASSAL